MQEESICFSFKTCAAVSRIAIRVYSLPDAFFFFLRHHQLVYLALNWKELVCNRLL